jgi:16S rRNA G966 N2-methylase RsmD
MKINYSVQFQKLIVNYAVKTSQIRAASVFNLARKQIFNWLKHVRAKGTILLDLFIDIKCD